MKAGPLSRGAHRCLKALKSYDFMKKGWACPSQTTLAKDLKVTERQVKRYIAELEDAGEIAAKRRPNTSSAYYFRPNVPTVGTRNVPADVPADVPAIQLSLNLRSNVQPIRFEERKPAMERPAYYSTAEEIRLWDLAMLWISKHPEVSVTQLQVGTIMHAIEDAGGLLVDHIPGLTTLPKKGPGSETAGTVKKASGEA